MRLIQWSVFRKFGSYVKVKRPDVSKIFKNPENEKISPSKVLELKIKTGGPITVAEYMKTVLTNPGVGYYMQKDMIGEKGDFITSPEITQLFGEMIGIWINYEYKKIGSPKPWQLIELGPGRGTLTKDILKVLDVFKATDDLSIHLVEVSQGLANLQLQNLCDSVIPVGHIPRRPEGNPYYKKSTTVGDIPVFWYEKLEQVPKAFSVIVAHEFFDALPIHKFQKVADGYREVLINFSQTEKGESKFDYVLSPKETVMSKLLISKNETRDHVEVCPDAGAIAKHVAERLEEYGGFSLFIDYGHNGEKTDTFRAFNKHKLHDPLVNPGTADLTADVDFLFLKNIMKDKMLIFGPVEQGDFLERLGIKIRLDMLIKNAEKEVAENIKSCYHMIVDKNQMGSRYKCLAAFPLVLKECFKNFSVSGFA